MHDICLCSAKGVDMIGVTKERIKKIERTKIFVRVDCMCMFLSLVQCGQSSVVEIFSQLVLFSEKSCSYTFF
jgi:hypothetical protein